MEARFKKVINPADASFIVRQDGIHAKNFWHYHPEFEIAYFKEARGTNFIGDNIEDIHEGEVILFGQNQPHVTQKDVAFYEANQHLNPKILLVQFDKNILGPAIWQKREFLHIAAFLGRTERGIRFTGKTAETAAVLIEKMTAEKGARKIMLLFYLLETLAMSEDFSYISSCGFTERYDETDDKINTIYEYTINHFREDIKLAAIARQAYLSQSAFCRYFKGKTAKTYNQFLIEVRLGYACKLLLQEKLNISEICYECGYRNLSNFNRQFKEIMHFTPSEYCKNFKNAAPEHYELVA